MDNKWWMWFILLAACVSVMCWGFFSLGVSRTEQQYKTVILSSGIDVVGEYGDSEIKTTFSKGSTIHYKRGNNE